MNKLIKRQKDNPENNEESLVSHLTELRQRIIYIIIFMAVIFLVLFPFKDFLYSQFAVPAIKNLSDGENFIIPKPIDAFLIPVKLCLFISFLVTLPWTLYQIWGFVSPGLYKKEKKLIVPIIVSSTVLFYVGIAFAYFVVLPIMFHFLAGINLEGVKFTPDIGNYFSIVIGIFFAFGVSFEIPIFTIILIISGIAEVSSLKSKRKYIIVGSFFIAMFITPPDAISQVFMALPMWILFEVGLFFGKKIEDGIEKQRQKEIDGSTIEDKEDV